MGGDILRQRHDRLEIEFEAMFGDRGPFLLRLRPPGLRFRRPLRRGRRAAVVLAQLLNRAAQFLEFAAEILIALGLCRPLVTLGKRLEAVLDEAPDWMDGPARARVEGAIASLGWRAEREGGEGYLVGRRTPRSVRFSNPGERWQRGPKTNRSGV